MIKLAEKLIKESNTEELAKILEEILCEECTSKLNNYMANKFIEDNVKPTQEATGSNPL